MERMSKNFMNGSRLTEAIRFCIAGGLTFLLDYGLLAFFTEWLGMYYFYSALGSFTVAVVVNYWICVGFVFKVKQQGRIQKILFLGSSIMGLGLNQFCMWLFVECVQWHYLFAKVLATVVVFGWNYWAKRMALLE